MRLDAHQHFWKYDPVRDSWITGEMAVLQRDYLPEHLEPQLKTHYFDGCIAVQADQSEGENAFLLNLAEANNFIKGVVGWVDLQAVNLPERLHHYKAFPKLKGFRHILQGEPRRDLMLKEAFKNGIRLLGKSNYTYDILIFPDQLPYALELVREFDEQHFVIDHLAKPPVRTGAVEEWGQGIEGFKELDHVFCKVSGLVTEADLQNWKSEDFRTYLDVIVETFGTSRLMFGSDWPVCLLAADYADVVGIVSDYFSSFSKSEQEAIFGDNAMQFYNIE